MSNGEAQYATFLNLNYFISLSIMITNFPITKYEDLFLELTPDSMNISLSLLLNEVEDIGLIKYLSEIGFVINISYGQMRLDKEREALSRLVFDIMIEGCSDDTKIVIDYRFGDDYYAVNEIFLHYLDDYNKTIREIITSIESDWEPTEVELEEYKKDNNI